MASPNEQPASAQDDFLSELIGYVKDELDKPSPGAPEPRNDEASTPQDS